MPARKVSNKQIRDIQRIVHLIAALVLLFYVYGPLDGAPGLAPLLRFAVLPLLVVTGLLMWQWTRLRKLVTPSLRGTALP
ncbi:hypothetical protein EPA93_24560 [Ktedonosporobacter rubrisoli]|uniref:Uncharacterized protein n=1 Tax=Ktedonosporobacter rubrisoli TaxID=2509675 RepID=A0A4P6JUH2_KTERU|nr:hypothetical protein [Ktedonosporobacter rubrisoli]QBD78983.1 hypothetical protein EPA93_24560 [Ktedonosporobacter rubrisoli]